MSDLSNQLVNPNKKIRFGDFRYSGVKINKRTNIF